MGGEGSAEGGGDPEGGGEVGDEIGDEESEERERNPQVCPAPRLQGSELPRAQTDPQHQ